MRGRRWWWMCWKVTKHHLQLAFGHEGGGGSGRRLRKMKKTTSSSHLDVREVVMVAAWGWQSLVAGKERKKWRKQATTFVVTHFLDAPLGPPTFWVPPRVSLPLTPLFTPTSLWRGEGWMWLACWWWSSVWTDTSNTYWWCIAVPFKYNKGPNRPSSIPQYLCTVWIMHEANMWPYVAHPQVIKLDHGM